MPTSYDELIGHARLGIIIKFLYFINRIDPSVVRRIYETKPWRYLSMDVRTKPFTTSKLRLREWCSDILHLERTSLGRTGDLRNWTTEVYWESLLRRLYGA